MVSAKMGIGLAVAMCLSLSTWRASAQDVTYAENVGPILKENCVDDVEIDVIQRWVAARSLRGDETLLPPAPMFSDGWQIGDPDLVLAWDSPAVFFHTRGAENISGS